MKITVLGAIIPVAVVAYTQAQDCTNQPSVPQCQGNRNEGSGGSNCRAGRRFFFDENSRSCRSMEYRGCGGNANRFCRESVCTQTCLQGTNPPGEGQGGGSTAARGGGGRGGGRGRGRGRGRGGGSGDCSNQPRTPNCSGGRDEGRGGTGCQAGKRHFFDSNSRRCSEMQYRGCGGNDNRHCTERECQQACRR